MKSLLIGINAKYIHPACGVFQIIANAKSEVDYLEFTIKDSPNKIYQKIKGENFDLLLFSVYIWNVEIVKEILLLLNDDHYIIVLGGPEVSYNPLYFFENYKIKYIIKNEGEESFNELIAYLCHQRKLSTVSNLYYYDNGLKETYFKCCDLKNIKHDFSLIKDFENRICYLEASRGCYFKCSYCLASIDNNVRFFPLHQTLANLKYLLDKKAKTIKFLDRSFNVNKNYSVPILEYLLKNDNQYSTVQLEIVGDLLTTEEIVILKKMRQGYIRLEIGIQSITEQVNKAINRHQNFEKIIANLRQLNNIIIHIDLIAGLPFEDKKSFIKTFNETFLLYPHELQLGFLKELKGTKISQTKEEHQYNFNDLAPYEIISNAYLSKNDLDEIRLVEASLDKFYNKGCFIKTWHYLFDQLNLDPFTIFKSIAYVFQEKLKTAQPHQLAKLLYQHLQTFTNEEQYLLFLMKQDYLEKEKTKPHIWWEYNITKKNRFLYYQEIIKNYPDLTLDYLYHYGHLEKYLDTLYLITYRPKKIYFHKIKEKQY